METILDVLLAGVVGILAFLLIGFVLLAWQNGHGWVILPIIGVGVIVTWACTYEARGSDIYHA
jgi:hypothetical protein